MAAGTARVTRDMAVQVHEGEAILPRKFNPFAEGTMPVVATIPGLEALGRQIAMTGQSLQASPQTAGDLMAIPTIIFPQPGRGDTQTPSIPTAQTERIELNINLDGDVVHRSVVERDRRAALRGSD